MRSPTYRRHLREGVSGVYYGWQLRDMLIADAKPKDRGWLRALPLSASLAMVIGVAALAMTSGMVSLCVALFVLAVGACIPFLARFSR